MKRAIGIFLVLSAIGILNNSARAQVEPIGPIDLFAPAAEAVFGPYDNVLAPPPAYKDFTFAGSAENPAGGPTGQPRTLVIQFGWNQNGAPVWGPPQSENWSHAGPHPLLIQWRLGFCPEKVYIRFATVEGSITDIQGDFVHECLPGSIPTLSEWGFIILAALVAGCLIWIAVRRWRLATA